MSNKRSRQNSKGSNNNNHGSGGGSGKEFKIELLNSAQKLAWAAFQKHDVLFLIGPAGTGKAQPHDSIIFTPTGSKTMGEIKSGDEILTPNGVSTVLQEHPQGEIEIYRINFVDGDSVECCKNHLWKVNNSINGWKSPKVVTTDWIIDNYCNQKRRNLEIELPSKIEFKPQEVAIDPYFLGFLLGDGCFCGTTPFFSTADSEIIEFIKPLLKENYSINKLQSQYEYSISKPKDGGKSDFYKECLKKYNLWGKKSEHKFIPTNYLYNSEEIRIGILQGLMDSDGSVDKRGYVEFSSSSKKIAEDVKFLVQSLGGLCKIVERSTSNLPSYRCHIKHINPSILFKLERKKNRCKKRDKLVRRIKNVDYVGIKEAKCITISSEEKLYLTNNFIVTHNTFLATAFAIKSLLGKDSEKIVLTRPIVEAGESLGFLPGDFQEKVNPYMLPMFDCIDKLIGYGDSPQKSKIMERTEIAPLAYMRGRAETLDSPIMTPNGIKLMGEIKVGDQVIGSDGQPINVVGVYPQEKESIYKVTFSDKTYVKCSGDHLWSTMTLNEKKNNKYSVKTTKEILENVVNKHGQKIHRVPILSGPVAFTQQELNIDPYLLGILLGDGHISKGTVRISSNDEEIVSECTRKLPEGVSIKLRKNIDYALVSQNGKNNLLDELYKLDLVGKKSHNKFIPDIYKFNSVEVRLEMLKGIMDADGWICKHRSGNCRIQYCSASLQLAEDVKFLVRSLGGYAYSRKREFEESDYHSYNEKIIKHVNPSYVVDILINLNPFKLTRKADQFSSNSKPAKLISKVEYIGEEKCQCIQVDSKDCLYVTNGFTLTHNTFDDSICVFDEAQNATKSQLKLFMSRFGQKSKLIITGDPRQSDIGSGSGLAEVVNRLKGIPGIGVIEFQNNSIVRHPLIGEILSKLEDVEG